MEKGERLGRGAATACMGNEVARRRTALAWLLSSIDRSQRYPQAYCGRATGLPPPTSPEPWCPAPRPGPSCRAMPPLVCVTGGAGFVATVRGCQMPPALLPPPLPPPAYAGTAAVTFSHSCCCPDPHAGAHPSAAGGWIASTMPLLAAGMCLTTHNLGNLALPRLPACCPPGQGLPCAGHGAQRRR